MATINYTGWYYNYTANHISARGLVDDRAKPKTPSFFPLQGFELSRRFGRDTHCLKVFTDSIVKNRATPKWVALENGTKDFNLWSPGLILTHTRCGACCRRHLQRNNSQCFLGGGGRFLKPRYQKEVGPPSFSSENDKSINNFPQRNALRKWKEPQRIV